MNQTKPVTWFADAPKANTFFFRSPFRSTFFLFNTVLAVGLLGKYISTIAHSWNLFNQSSNSMLLLTFPLFTIIYPYLGVLREHSRINEIYRGGNLSQASPDSPSDQVLKLAADSLLSRLFVMLGFSGFMLFAFLLPKISEHK